MFGVPGDFNLAFLVSVTSLIFHTMKLIIISGLCRRLFGHQVDWKLVCRSRFLCRFEPHIELHNSNELNAAYAADGYARVNEHGIGVITTTYVPLFTET